MTTISNWKKIALTLKDGFALNEGAEICGKVLSLGLSEGASKHTYSIRDESLKTSF